MGVREGEMERQRSVQDESVCGTERRRSRERSLPQCGTLSASVGLYTPWIQTQPAARAQIKKHHQSAMPEESRLLTAKQIRLTPASSCSLPLFLIWFYGSRQQQHHSNQSSFWLKASFLYVAPPLLCFFLNISRDAPILVLVHLYVFVFTLNFIFAVL